MGIGGKKPVKSVLKPVGKKQVVSKKMPSKTAVLSLTKPKAVAKKTQKTTAAATKKLTPAKVVVKKALIKNKPTSRPEKTPKKNSVKTAEKSKNTKVVLNKTDKSSEIAKLFKNKPTITKTETITVREPIISLEKIKNKLKEKNFKTLLGRSEVIMPEVTVSEREEITLPEGQALKRLQIKSIILDNLLNNQGRIWVSRGAKLTGYIFIFVGLGLSAVSLNLLGMPKLMPASVVCLENPSDCQNEMIMSGSTTGATDVSGLDVVQPTITFINTLPKTATDKIEIGVTSTQISHLEVFLVSENSDLSTILPNQNASDTAYSGLIDTSRLTPEVYKLRATGLGNDGVLYQVDSAVFMVAKEVASPISVVSTEISTTTSENHTETNEVTAQEIKAEEVMAESVFASSTPEDINREEKEDNKDKQTEGVKDTTSPAVVAEFVNSSLVGEGLKITPTDTLTRFLVSAELTNVKEVLVFLRPKLSTVEYFLTSLQEVTSGQWQGLIKADNLPFSSYEIILKTTALSGEETILPPTTFNWLPTETSQNYGRQREALLHIEKVKQILGGDETASSSGFTNLLTLRTAYYQAYATEKGSLSEKNIATLNKLLTHYASAVSTGNVTLITLAEKTLSQTLNELVMAGQLSAATLADLAKIKDQIKINEKILIEKTDSLITRDTDGDGISDFDEVALYETDPNLVDTDSDGVLDGVEIMTNYNPASYKFNAIANFSDPKLVNAVSEDLVVGLVRSVVRSYQTDGTTQNWLEVTGHSLPNSFVTLHLFDAGLTAWVKTDNSGNFKYTLEKALPDGDYQIYLTQNDNTGAIINRSLPFGFNKQAKIVRPTALAGGERKVFIANTPTTATADTTVQNTSASLGVVSFGLILLIAGQYLADEAGAKENKSSTPTNTKTKPAPTAKTKKPVARRKVATKAKESKTLKKTK